MLPDGLQDGADDENVVEDGETRQAAVEDGAHLLRQQDGDGHGVGEEAERAQHDLDDALHPPREGVVHLQRDGVVAFLLHRDRILRSPQVGAVQGPSQGRLVHIHGLLFLAPLLSILQGISTLLCALISDICHKNCPRPHTYFSDDVFWSVYNRNTISSIVGFLATTNVSGSKIPLGNERSVQNPNHAKAD